MLRWVPLRSLLRAVCVDRYLRHRYVPLGAWRPRRFRYYRSEAARGYGQGIIGGYP